MPKQTKAITPQRDSASYTREELQTLIEKAQSGDKSAAELACQVMKHYPDVIRTVYDMAGHLRSHMITFTISTKNQLLPKIYEVKTKTIEKDLAGPNPTPMERILAERAATCWLAANLADMDASTGGRSLTAAEYYDRRAQKAHARFLAAVESLARVRRLALPVQQINIAQAGAQQLNVATNTPALDAG